MRKRARPEEDIQKAVIGHLATRSAENVFWFHVPQGNKLGGKRTKSGVPIQGIINKYLGVRAGVPDLILVHKGRIYALELKAPGGRTTEKQHATIMALGAAGAFCAVAEGLDRALNILEMWGLLRGRTGAA